MWNRYGIDVFSISVPHENPLFSRLFQLLSRNGTDGTDVNILSSYKEKIYKKCVYKELPVLSVPCVPKS